MSGEQRPSGPDSFEKAKAALESIAPPIVTPEVSVAREGGEGTKWDKAAPTGPPGAVQTQYAPWFQPILKHFRQIVTDESVFAELCLERALDIFKRVHDKGLVGIDHFADAAGGGGGATRTNLAAAAVPFAVEFYKQATVSLNQRQDEFNAAWNETLALKKLDDGNKLTIVGQ